jgi:hypothetical protein
VIHVTIPRDRPDANNVALCDPKEERSLELDNSGGVTLYRLDPGNPAAYRERRKGAITSGEDICRKCDAEVSRVLGQYRHEHVATPPRHNTTEWPTCPICLVYGELGQGLKVVERFTSAAPGGASTEWPEGMVGGVVHEGQPRSDGYIHLALTHPNVYGSRACLCVVGYKMRPVQPYPPGPKRVRTSGKK